MGVPIFFSEIFSYFCFLVAAFRPCHGSEPLQQWNASVQLVFISFYKFSVNDNNVRVWKIVHLVSTKIKLRKGQHRAKYLHWTIKSAISLKKTKQEARSELIKESPLPVEVHEHVAEWLHVISPTLLDSQMGVDRGVARSAR